MEPDNVQARIWHYLLDTEGHLWHDGTEFEDPDTLRFFMRKMKRLPDGRYQVLCQGETCFIEPMDVPYVIQDIEVKGDRMELVFPGDYRERLDPATLQVGKDNVLYCKVRNGAFDARFNRKPYLELAHYVERDESGRYCLRLGGEKYPIAGV